MIPLRICNSIYALLFFLTAVDIKCVYGLAGAGILTGATTYTLKHCQENPALVAAFNSCALPAGVELIKMSKGCVCFTVKAESLSALKALWERYENGSLQKSLEDLLITDEINKMAEGKAVELRVNIDQDSYRNACLSLFTAEKEGRAGFFKLGKLLDFWTRPVLCAAPFNLEYLYFV